MIISLKHTYLLLLFPLAAMLSSCSNSGCSDMRSAIPLATLAAAPSGAAISIDSIEVAGVGAPVDNAIIVNESQRVSQFYMPLRANASEVTYRISYMQKSLRGLYDDITLKYISWPWLASQECGAMYKYRLTEVTHTRCFLDSIAILPSDSIISNLDVASLRLYFQLSRQ